MKPIQFINYSSSSVQLTTTIYLEVDWQVIASVEGLELIKDDTISPITFNGRVGLQVW